MKVTIKGGIFADISYLRWQSAPKLTFCEGLTEDFSTYIFIQPHEFEVELPDNFDYRPAAVRALEKERDELRAKFASDVMLLDQRINSLLAIENSA